MNPIKTYTVRRPGCTAWSDGHQSIAEAFAERDRAERVVQGHQVYAKHVDGAVTGPYPRNDIFD